MKRIFLGISLLQGLASCFAPQETSEIPMPRTVLPDIEVNTNLRALLESYEQSGETIYSFPAHSQAVAEGFVISSDEGGNFYKTLVVQDHWSDPNMGLSIKIGLRSYYARYPLGSKIVLSAAGLAMSLENGVPTIGYLNNGSIDPIPESLLEDFIARTDVNMEIQPRLLEMEELGQYDLLTMVRLDEAQFLPEERGKTYASERYDSYYAVRSMLDCSLGLNLDLITSTYADYKTMLLPSGKFRVDGILTTGSHRRMSLEIISPEFIYKQKGERCDPVYRNCQETESDSLDVLYYEDFDGLASTAALEEKGWINVNLNFKNEKFRKRSENGNTFLRISAYGSGELAMEAWLVSPVLDLDEYEKEILSFRTRATYQEGRALSVWVSSDHNSDPGQAKWELLDCDISEGTSDGSNEAFLSSGKIFLSCLEGKIRIGFRYQGGDPGVSTTYDIDNFLLKGALKH